MEFEKIKSTLVGQIGQTSLSDRTITDYIKNVLPPEGTEPDDAYFKAHAAILTSLSGNLSHDVATRVDDFKKNYKPEPPTPSTPPAPPAPNQSEEYKAAMEKIKALEEAMAKKNDDSAMKSLESKLQQLLDANNKNLEQKQIDSLFSTLRDRVSAAKLVINDKPTWDLAADMIKSELKSDTTGDKMLEMVKDKYDSLYKRLHPGGGSTPFGETSSNNHESPIQAYLKQKIELEKAEAERRAKFAESLK